MGDVSDGTSEEGEGEEGEARRPATGLRRPPSAFTSWSE